MDRTPLFFRYQGPLVAGRGFIAQVTLEGRCLLEHTGRNFVSLLGVNPGAVAGQGDSSDEAYRELRENIELVILDFAMEAASFDQFKEAVERFALETNRPLEVAWRASVEAAPAGKVAHSEFPEWVDASQQPSVTVELVVTQDYGELASKRQLAPDLNRRAGDLPLVAVG